MVENGSKGGGELFIVDNSDAEWKVLHYLQDWAEIANKLDIATGTFEIGSLLALDGKWQKLEKLRVLMGDEVSKQTKKALLAGLERIETTLDDSIEVEKETNDFLTGTEAIVDALRKKQIECRVYNKKKFHAKAYITHGKHAVIGSTALVGSSNLTYPGLTENVELNVQIRREVELLQEWYERHWNEAHDITDDILKVIERHTREYSPFDVYARSLQEYIEHYEMDDADWENNHSKIYKILAKYQQNGYHGLLRRANKYSSAFLCDGVGLGKTFIGLMLIERLVVRDKKRVVLFVPKAARQSVWESKIRKYIPEVLGGFMSFRIFNHTDLMRRSSGIPFELRQMKEQAEVVIIDEAHHFRNTGIRGEDGERRSRYWEMYDLCEGKKLFMLTATPINNRLTDLQHMIELFSRDKTDYFKIPPLGIHSLSGHIRKLEKAIENAALQKEKKMGSSDTEIDDGATNLAEAAEILRDDLLFEELVVQRSRVYVKKSLKQEDSEVLFPEPSAPQVVPYSVKQTYGKLLKMVEDAFRKDKPLFSLGMYYPWEYYKGPPEDLKEQKIAMVAGRQMQVVRLIRTAFLKRFESSIQAFEFSCRTLMKKLIAFYYVNATSAWDHERLEKWLRRNKSITGLDPDKRAALFDDLRIEMQDEDVVEPEFFEAAAEGRLDTGKFNVEKILSDTIDDLETIGEFLKELANFEPKQDKKLSALIKLLNNDKVLSSQKCLIFSEFKDTARYLEQQLKAAGIEGVMEIDSDESADSRADIITSFAPYYNDSSSSEITRQGLTEMRILISTDVLSEGLNLQDATRLINYDLHWNPVRLMQRVGRIDRRLDRQIEKRMVEDHPELEEIRGTIQYYNFLPPEELNELLDIYKKVTRKTLRISKTFGIENGKLLRPDDDYDILKDFISQCEGAESMTESLSLEYQRLLAENPGLAERLAHLPGSVFSGKETPGIDTQAVFFCYARPAKDIQTGEWSIEAGDSQWYLYRLIDEAIIEEPSQIARFIRSTPDTPRVCKMEKKTLSQIKAKVEKFILQTYLKKVNAPDGVAAKLIAWMEIS
jgi:superfamily II DNA or RNA helicase